MTCSSFSSTPLFDLKLSFIADRMPQIVWLTDATGVLTYCNQRWVEYTGLSVEATIAGEWNQVVHPDDIIPSFNAWNQALLTQTSYEVESRFKCMSDGIYRWHLVRGFPIKNDLNVVVGWIGTSTNIDDLKKTEQSLRNSEQRYHTLLQALHSVYWTIDPIGAAVSPQPSWEAFSGQTWDEYKDFGWVQAVHPDDRESLLTAWQQAVNEVRIFQEVARYWSVKEQDYIYCIARAAPLVDENGQLIKWIGSCLDINAQKKSENKIQEISEHLKLALSSARGGAWSWNFIEDKVVWSEGTYKVFGLSADYTVTAFQDYQHLVHPLDRERIAAEVKEIIEKQHPEFDLDYSVIWPDGSLHYINSIGKTYVDQSGKIIKMVGVCFDVTERKLADALILKNQNDFARESKVSSISEVASSLAHELNQPLATIATFTQGCVDQLESGNFQPEAILYALKESAAQVSRAGEIIHRIKNSVQKRYLFLESTNFNDIVLDSIKFINFEKNDSQIEIQYQPHQDIPLVQVDKIQIQQVFVNLLRNALTALSNGNVVDPHIIITTEVKNSVLISKVSDNGPGFPAELEYRIDNIMDSKTGGMGIGLFICRSIIEAHRGKLMLSLSPEGGAQVQFKLPIYMEE